MTAPLSSPTMKLPDGAKYLAIFSKGGSEVKSTAARISPAPGRLSAIFPLRSIS